MDPARIVLWQAYIEMLDIAAAQKWPASTLVRRGLSRGGRSFLAVRDACQSLWLRTAVLVGATGTATYFMLVDWKHHAVTIDDAFISYRYADMLARGQGLVYNPGERVEGYTNFFWVLIAAIGRILGGDPFVLTRTLGLLALIGAIALCVAIVTHASEEPRWRYLLLLVAIPLLTMPKGLVQTAGTGLETTFVAFLALALGALNHLWVIRHPAELIFRCGVAFILLLTRLDSALTVAASGIMLIYQERSRLGSFKPMLRAVALWAGPVLLLLLTYLAWKFWYYRDIFPNSYYAKAGDLVSIEAGRLYLRAFLKSAPYVLLLIPVVLFGVFGTRGRPYHFFAAFLGLDLVLRVAYLLKVGGDFMEYRFIWQSYPLLIAAFLVGALEMARRTSVMVPVFATLLALSLVKSEVVLEAKYGMQSAPEMDGYAKLGIRIGRALGDVLPERTVVATTLAGTIAYFGPELVIIDQWGLNDKYVATLPLDKLPTNGRGHLKFAPDGYLAERGVNLYMAHPVICSCASPCVEAKPNVFIRLGNDECVRTWYFKQDERLTNYFCAHPEHFVLNRVDCANSHPSRYTPHGKSSHMGS
jgi:arabinofuranosyltransferase